MLNNDTVVERSDAPARCSTSPQPTHTSVRVGSVIYDLAATESRADVGRRRARTVERSHARCPQCRRSGRLLRRPRRCCCGPRPSVRSACSTPGTSSPGRTSTCAPACVDAGWRLAVAERSQRLAPLGWHPRAAVAGRASSTTPPGSWSTMRTHSPCAVADDAADARLLRGHGGPSAPAGIVARGVARLAGGMVAVIAPGPAGARDLGSERCREPTSSSRTGTAPTTSGRASGRSPPRTTPTSRSSSSTTVPTDDSMAVLEELAAEIAPVRADRAAQRRQPRVRRWSQPRHPPRHRRRGRRRRPVQQRRRRRPPVAGATRRGARRPTPTWRSSPDGC